jgi:hypothetical protein
LRKAELLGLLVSHHQVRLLIFCWSITFRHLASLAIWTNKSAFP